MPDTPVTPTEPATVRKEPSASTSATTAMALVVVLSWYLKTYDLVEIPGDVGTALGIIIMGVTHVAQMAWFNYIDARVRPKLPLPPAAPPQPTLQGPQGVVPVDTIPQPLSPAQARAVAAQGTQSP